MPTLKSLKDHPASYWLALLLMGGGGFGGAKALGFGSDERIAKLEQTVTELRIDIATIKGNLQILLERIPEKRVR